MKEKILNIQIIPPGGYFKEYEYLLKYKNHPISRTNNWVLEISYEKSSDLIVGFESFEELIKRLNIELGESYEDFEGIYCKGSSTT